LAIQIIGAGMAGLLAAEMLRREQPLVLERQTSLPDNHGALLRFRSEKVAQETRQQFKKVRVLKALKDERGKLVTEATLRHANQYSAKVTGSIVSRSIMNLQPAERYVAPDDFIERLAAGANIQYDAPFTADAIKSLRGQRELATISTMPMPVLMRMVDWPSIPEFEHRTIVSVTGLLGHIKCDVYQTIYYPDPQMPVYRASITGNKLILEYTPFTEPDLSAIDTVMKDFGIPWSERGLGNIRFSRQEYGKLLDIDTRARQEFVLAMTDDYNIYSVGRFATWRQLLLDDVVDDVRVVSRMITDRSAYIRRLYSSTKP
jgi:hypothetical protein